jgi:hypothetical protein
MEVHVPEQPIIDHLPSTRHQKPINKPTYTYDSINGESAANIDDK